jgi:RND family efflux transporter MFP subunit
MISRLWQHMATVSVVALGACSTTRSAETTDQPEPTAIAVRTETAAPIARSRAITASGVIEARTTVDVAFQVPGKVVDVGPDDGDVVREGDLLAMLDATDYRLAVDQSAAVAEQTAAERDRHRPLLAEGSVAPNDLERMESAARQSAAAAALARKHLADTRLLSPITGVVARRVVERGSTVSAGQPTFTLVDLDVVKVRIGVPEADVDALRPGQSATVRLPALRGATFPGRVTSVGVAADPTTRTYAVEITAPNATHRLKAGMVAEATVQVGGQTSSLLAVPATSVVRDAEGRTLLFVLDARTMRVHARRVKVGAAFGEMVEVTNGISAGDDVVVAGQHRLREGSTVRVTNTLATIEGGVR